MQVSQLLIDFLDDLCDADFRRFNWYLTNGVLDDYKRIPQGRLQKQSQMETVTEMINNYGEERAVNITVEILKKIHNINAAEKLKKAYAEERAATPSASSSASAPPVAPAASAAPTAISAVNGGTLIAPTIIGSTAGALNITINK